MAVKSEVLPGGELLLAKEATSFHGLTSWEEGDGGEKCLNTRTAIDANN